jgi:Putative 8-oxoguanine DNA glycosylase OGG-like protein
MAWGYGNVGYGTWRVGQALKDRDAGKKLLDVAIVLSTDGPQGAYRLKGGASRLHRIGPAFGTSFSTLWTSDGTIIAP